MRTEDKPSSGTRRFVEKLTQRLFSARTPPRRVTMAKKGTSQLPPPPPQHVPKSLNEERRVDAAAKMQCVLPLPTSTSTLNETDTETEMATNNLCEQRNPAPSWCVSSPWP